MSAASDAARPLRAAEGYIDITAQAGRKLQLYIAPATVLSGPAAPELGRELVELFAFDLGLAGPFSVPAPEAGADLVLKTSYAMNGTGLTLECRIFDAVLKP